MIRSVMECFRSVLYLKYRLKTQKNSHWKPVRLTMRLRSQTHARRMALQGCFSSLWKFIRLSFLNATLDAWCFSVRFSRNASFSSHWNSMRLTMRLTSQTYQRRMKLQNRFSSCWNFMRLTMRLKPKMQPQMHENPEWFSKFKKVLKLFKFSSIAD